MAPIEPYAILLQPPSGDEPSPTSRTASSYSPLSTFTLPTGTRTYTQQFSDLYFSRLTLLKPATTSLAETAWANFKLGGTTARRVDRVLDVRQGDLCWVVGTVFMELPLKPNVLEDVGREHWIAAPVHGRSAKFFNVPSSDDSNGEGKVTAGTGYADRKVMLEDESGRLRLAGDFLTRDGDGSAPLLVTGAIIAVLGTENADGEFEVLDVQLPDLARQPQRWEREDADVAIRKEEKVQERPRAGKIALVSGLGISGDQGDTLRLELLAEWLLGEAGFSPSGDVAGISRLFILGNSLAAGGPIPSRAELAMKKGSGANATKKYGYDSSSYNAAPTDTLDAFLADLLPSLPVTLLPGDTDPTQAALPQQPLHGALFPRARNYMPAPGDAVGVKGKAPGRTAAVQAQPGWFHSATNPWEGDVDGWRFLATGGQPVEDMCRYVLTEERTEIMESTLRWRVVAPTCPDTLWCYPFQDGDAFVLKATPHVYLAGCQPRFETDVIEGPQGQAVRLIAVPKFAETGEVVLLDAETLEVEVVQFDLFGEEG